MMAIPPRLDLVQKAIRDSIANIDWKSSAFDRVVANPLFGQLGLSPLGIRVKLHKFVCEGNCLQLKEETRNEIREADPDHPHWYKAVIPCDGLPGGLFVEVILLDDDEEDPFVQIVNCHE